MKLLVDTHILLWWYLDSPELPRPFAALLAQTESAGDSVGISGISLWELAKLAELRRIQLGSSLDALFDRIDADPLVRVLPITGRIAAESTRLGPSFHRDPADQLIAATARCHGLSLMTADERIRSSGVVSLA